MQAARTEAGAQTIHLSDGETAYHLEGSASDPCVVLVHGLLTPSFAFERLSGALVQAGFRVLRYDEFGRGLSDRPNTRYDQTLYLRQLRELLAGLDIRSAHFVAWSMGGIIACNHALAHPEQVESLVLIAPALFLPRPRSLSLVQRIPGGDALIARQVRRFVAALAGQQFREPERFAELSRRSFQQLEFPGLGQAFASTLRHFPWQAGSTLTALSRHSRPVLVIWGKDDPTTRFSQCTDVCALLPRAELVTFAQARHAPHLEHHDQVLGHMVRFLRAAG
jgi:pimeloyl-ACP methyl ester carboxylesterase